MNTKYNLLLILIFSRLLFIGQQDSTSKSSDWRLFPAEKKTELHQLAITNQPKLEFNKNGSSKVFQDARIDKIGEEIRNKPYIYGYTIQLAVSQQKSIIKDARYKIIKISPDIELDDPYESPNIYLYAGRFYDRATAYQYKKEIENHFPNAVVVGPKMMDLPYIKMPEPEIINQESDSLVPVDGYINNQ